MMVYNCTRSKPKRLAEQMDKFNRQQKDLLAMAVFREDEKVVRAWHRARNVVSMRRRIRVTKNQVKNMDSLGVGVGGGGGGTGAAEEGGGDAVITIAPAAAAATAPRSDAAENVPPAKTAAVRPRAHTAPTEQERAETVPGEVAPSP